MRTENDLRAMYSDQPDAADVERRLTSWIAGIDQQPTELAARTRRSWVAPTASAAAVAAVAISLAVGLANRHFGPSSAGGQPSAPPVTAAQSNQPNTPVSVSPPPAADVPVTPQVALSTLLDLLPRPGTTTDLTGRTGEGWTGAEAVYDDGHGAARIAIALSYPFKGADGSEQRQAAGSLCASVTNGDPCTTAPDGSQLTVFQSTEFTRPAHGSKDWEIRLLRTDGVEVDITEWNAATEKAAVTTRVDPPFTIAELSAIARSPQWQASVSAGEAQATAGLFVADS